MDISGHMSDFMNLLETSNWMRPTLSLPYASQQSVITSAIFT